MPLAQPSGTEIPVQLGLWGERERQLKLWRDPPKSTLKRGTFSHEVLDDREGPEKVSEPIEVKGLSE
jgi:hypothetical protein